MFSVVDYIYTLSHLECLVAPDGDPDVVPVSDLLLVQQDHGWRGRLLGREAVSGAEGVPADRPGGPGGVAVRRPGQAEAGQAGHDHPAPPRPVSAN